MWPDSDNIAYLYNLDLQLYEFNMDPTRKSFLDDLFTFMQNRGTPINRLPIMAKQVIISKVEILFHSLTTRFLTCTSSTTWWWRRAGWWR